METRAETLARLTDEVMAGRSLTSVGREFDKHVQQAVRDERRRREDAARRAYTASLPAVADDGEPAPEPEPTCSLCGLAYDDCSCEFSCDRCEESFSHALEADGHGRHLCEACARRTARDEWLDATEAALTAAAERGGWRIERTSIAGTGSRYLSLGRFGRKLSIRIADHGSAYCHEDYSVAMQPGGDDHDLEMVCRILIGR